MTGSSPLARGLRQHHPDDPGGTGIIPARAGFTHNASATPPGKADHPRSRGVYAARGGRTVEIRGSSPLARGLLASASGRSQHGGIIPARAGFTVDGTQPGTRRRDHPRSRGVYAAPASKSGAASGSSPLARGLRDLIVRDVDGDRIIPARAGFTAPQGTSVRCAWDHPRSRGVYPGEHVDALPPRGSSPLARGLPHLQQAGSDRRGIIPARAGFTTRVFYRRTARQDHPRSRGVYGLDPVRRPAPLGIIPARAGFTEVQPVNPRGACGSSPLARGLLLLDYEEKPIGGIIPARAGFTRCASTASSCAFGSSPLARGLRVIDWHPGGDHRIIPARAGFTPSPASGRRSHPDHPRSRGVYAAWPDRAARSNGSSPLARGLQVDVDAHVRAGGIIPARAGFTSPPETCVPGGTDHPRSRGVYKADAQVGTCNYGSSPLARGLPSADNNMLVVRGIIPARAGFTIRCDRTRCCAEDHPRSRGVYRGRRVRGSRTWGSSPLARGLHRGDRSLHAPTRIIPARAGFTGVLPVHESPTSDHPRSRGVYWSDFL